MSGSRNIISLKDVPTHSTGHSQVQFMASSEATGSKSVSIIYGSLPPGGIVPLHSHSEFESLYIIRGEMDAYQDDGSGGSWNPAYAGDLIVVRSGVKHALRNRSSTACDALITTGLEVYNFLRGISQPFDPDHPPVPPTPKEIAHMTELANKYHQWMATPAENAAIGLTMS